MRDVTVSFDWCSKLVAYLGAKPYQEVFEMLAELQAFIKKSATMQKENDEQPKTE